MLNLQFHLQGVSPLILHNIEASDPLNEWSKQLSKISSKKKKTEEDHAEMERIQWFSGLYTDHYIKGVVMPTKCLRKAFIVGARARKLGKHVERGLKFHDMAVPIIHNGPNDFEKLHQNSSYHSRESVKIGNSRIMRVRPKFSKWEIQANASLDTDLMDLDELQNIAEYTGRIEGLCDNRINGFGRFQVKINVFATV